MELADIMALVKAGFTKDEITQMALPRAVTTSTVSNEEPVQMAMDLPTPTPEPAPAQVVEPVSVAKPVAVPIPGQEHEQMEVTKTTLDDIMNGIAKLTSAVQANAIAQSVIPNGMQRQQTAEDMLAEIIRPTFKEVKE